MICLFGFLVGCGSSAGDSSASEPTETEDSSTLDDSTQETEDTQAQDGTTSAVDGQPSEPPESQQEQVTNKATVKLGHAGQNYSEGLAWVKLAEGDISGERYGCIDQTGKVLFAIPFGHENAYPTPFENGFSYIFSDGNPYVSGNPYVGGGRLKGRESITLVDADGNASTFYADELGDLTNVEKEDREIVGCGGSYFVLFRRQQADFDRSDYPYVYEVYGPDGVLYDYLSCEREHMTYYRGQGVFEFKDMTDNVSVLFFTNTDKWIEVYAGDDVIFLDGEDIAFVAERDEVVTYQAVGEDDSERSLYSGLVFVTKDGEVLSYNPPKGVHTSSNDPRVSDGRIVLVDENTWYAYDIHSESLTQMSEEYAKRDSIAGRQYSREFFHDGVCVILTSGADQQVYMCAYDYDWNRLYEPMPFEPGHSGHANPYYSEGFMVVYGIDSDNHAYPMVVDKEGGVVFSKDGGNLTPFHNGAFIACDDFKLDPFYNYHTVFDTESSISDSYRYLDKDGNPLFDTLNTESMKELTLSW